jgi:hypothetical protein
MTCHCAAYLPMNGLPVGLLLDFHALRLKDGLRRFVGGVTFFSVAPVALARPPC